MIFNVYIYEGTTSSEELSHELAGDAVRHYCAEKDISFDERLNRWDEHEKGKTRSQTHFPFAENK